MTDASSSSNSTISTNSTSLSFNGDFVEDDSIGPPTFKYKFYQEVLSGKIMLEFLFSQIMSVPDSLTN